MWLARTRLEEYTTNHAQIWRGYKVKELVTSTLGLPVVVADVLIQARLGTIQRFKRWNWKTTQSTPAIGSVRAIAFKRSANQWSGMSAVGGSWSHCLQRQGCMQE